MPLVGLGTFALTSEQPIRDALALGYRHFDAAAFYGNEDIVGRGLAEFAATSRHELFVTTKVWQTDHHPADARASVLRSLAKLGLQHLDLVLVHWPEAWLPGSEVFGEVFPDDSIGLVETWRGLQALVDEGLVRSLGVSNFNLDQIQEVLAAARHKPVVNQIELHPLLSQRELVEGAAALGVVSVAHTPTCQQAKALAEHPAMAAVTAATGRTVSQVCLRWNVQRGVPVIPKATSAGHLRENFGIFDWQLSPEQQALLDGMDVGHRVWDFPWKKW